MQQQVAAFRQQTGVPPIHSKPPSTAAVFAHQPYYNTAAPLATNFSPGHKKQVLSERVVSTRPGVVQQ